MDGNKVLTRIYGVKFANSPSNDFCQHIKSTLIEEKHHQLMYLFTHMKIFVLGAVCVFTIFSSSDNLTLSRRNIVYDVERLKITLRFFPTYKFTSTSLFQLINLDKWKPHAPTSVIRIENDLSIMQR